MALLLTLIYFSHCLRILSGCRYYTVPKFGGSFLMQALPPLPGCPSQRLLVTNYTDYGLSSRVVAFNITEGPASEF